MTGKTRTFVIASLLVLMVGLGTGLVASYGLQARAFSSQGGPDELRLLPRSTSLVAYADVHEIMLSAIRQKFQQLHGDGQQELQAQTGINIETDIDHVVVGLVPLPDGQAGPSGVVLARGRFEDARIEALMTSHGATIDTYKGKHVLTAPAGAARNPGMSVAFIDQGLVALGSAPLVRSAIDLTAGGESVLANDELMKLVRSLDDGNVWAVGKFDAFPRGRMPGNVASQLPPIGWLSASGRIDNDIRGAIRAETKDADAAQNLREVVRGFMALAKLQMASQPDLREFVDSLSLGGTDKTVTLSFEVPTAVIDTLAAHRRPRAEKPGVEPGAQGH